MPPPTMNAVPHSDTPLHRYASVIKTFPVEWDDYFKHLVFRMKVRCCYCGGTNKHGISFQLLEHIKGDAINDSRTCDHCFKEYRFLVVV